MRKLLCILSMVLLLASCGKDDNLVDDKIGIERAKTLKSSQSAQIKIETASVNDLTFTSEDPYIASVDDKGVVYAKIVGKTNIVVSDGINKSSCAVTVEPIINHPEPFYDFGASMKSVKSYMESRLVDNLYVSRYHQWDPYSNSYSIGYSLLDSTYTSESGYYLKTQYYFEDDKLFKVKVYFDSSVATVPSAYLFMGQYYYITNTSKGVNDVEFTYTNKAQNVRITAVATNNKKRGEYSILSATYLPIK